MADAPEFLLCRFRSGGYRPSVAVAAGSGYVPVNAGRLVFGLQVGPGESLAFQVDGVDGVPTAGVAAVNLTVTGTDSTTSYLTAFLDGTSLPGTVSVSLNPGQTTSDVVIVAPGSDGYVDIYNNAATATIYVDIYGYYVGGSGATYTSLSPSSRIAGPVSVGPGQSAVIQVAGVDGLPSTGIVAVTATLSSAGDTAGGYLVCYADETPLPGTSSENLTVGVVTSVLVQCAVGQDGKVDIYNATGSTQVYFDADGFSSAAASSGSAYQPVVPTRVVSGQTLSTGIQNFTLAGVGPAPANATVVVADVSVASCTQAGYLELWASGASQPNPPTVVLSTQAGQAITTDLVFAPIGAGGQVTVNYSAGDPGSCQIYVDVDGYFAGGSSRLTGVGVYGGYGTQSVATAAITDGWPIVADAAALGTLTSPYTAEVSFNPDGNIVAAENATGGRPTWLSVWTVSWPSAGDTFHNAGYQGGVQAATTLDGESSTLRPDYVVLDPEGDNVAASTSAEWADFIDGWAAGITSVDSRLTPAFYANQSQYESFGLAGLTLKAFVAVSPILGNTPQVSGGNIDGYIAYSATKCPASPYEATISGWGDKYNTLQFIDSAVDCGP